MKFSEKQHRPPQWSVKLLRYFINDQYLEEIEGDMEEVFQDLLVNNSLSRARRIYMLEMLKLFRPALLRKLFNKNYFNRIDMFKNNLKIALRIFKKEKSFTAINLLGLSIGLWCTIIVALWVQDEFNFDKSVANHQQIYRVLKNDKLEGGKISTRFNTAWPIGDALWTDFPEITQRVRFTNPESMYLEVEKKLVEIKVSAADSNFFSLFQFPFLAGSPKQCLKEKNYVAISEEMAHNYYKDQSPIGALLRIKLESSVLEFVVQGVFKKLPENASFNFDMLLNIENYTGFHTYLNSWGNSWLTTYVGVNPQTDIAALKEKIKNFPKDKVEADWFTLLLQPFGDQYLYSKYENGYPAGGRIDYVILFSIIAVFTLLIACFNFVNLTTARSGKRAREIGIRKVMGANKSTLIFQFIFESMLIAFSATVFAVLMTQTSLPFFNQIASKDLFIDYLAPEFYLFLLVILFITLLFTAIYPALFLSSFNPVRALKGKLLKLASQIMLRKGLVTLQFCLSIMLIAGTIAIFAQLNFIQNKDLGLDKENVLYIPLNVETQPKYETLKSKLISHTGVANVSASWSNFSDPLGSSSDPKWNNGKGETGNKLWFSIMNADFGLMELMDIPLVSGRYFNPELSTDTVNYIINETAARVMGLENPIGADLEFWGNKGQIVGVVKDFNFSALYNPIAPIIIRCQPTSNDLMFVKTKPGTTQAVLKELEDMHTDISSLPFEFHFLDEDLEKSYRKEMITQKLAGIFSVLAIFISCLGLFGLASFAAQQRIKEIAIRKVLGARIPQVVNLLFKEYILIILLSFLVSIPVAYLWIDNWLGNFAFHINLNWWIFVIPGCLVFFIALLTIGRIAFRSAQTNPAISLRNE